MSLKVLVIDDDTDYTEMMRLRLESWGHTPTIVHNWLSAMMKTSRESFDLMLIDIETPTGNGLTACKDLCNDPKIAATPKVFITGRSDDDSIQRCYELNAKYIHKSSGVFDELLTVMTDLQQSKSKVTS
ncbi:MAG: response regulator [Pirellulaceae bacterium]|nr:response regulator [Pirellulaceae bacterium]